MARLGYRGARIDRRLRRLLLLRGIGGAHRRGGGDEWNGPRARAGGQWWVVETDRVILAHVPVWWVILSPRSFCARIAALGLELVYAKSRTEITVKGDPVAGSCKRRATSIPTSGWASLPWDIADLISLRLLAADVTEYIRFRAVCSPWRSSTASPRDATLLDKRFSPRGWVALCDGDGVPVTAACKITFFHTSTGQRLAVRLPELHRQKIVGITDGLIITLDKDSSVVRVLHPFTRVIVELPPLATIFHTEINNFTSLLSMGAAVCRADTSIAVVAWLTSAEMVICARQGHPSWVVIHRDIMLHNTLPFQGRLYGTIPASGQLVQLYPPNPRSCPA
ncbi:uncharacterized protein [Triticum aestivum]|uniref:uncharacterized protein n=1 Tax=Triticum aestivum TaxID=4565 RepID=UPI001D011B3C|nr:uncharacterized protein LOC123101392 [Triticum aestivum]